VAVSWILLVVIPLLNPKHIRKLGRDFCFAGLIYSLPLITIAAATAFGWMLAYLRGAIVISDVITGIAGTDPHLIMLMLVLLFTIVGDFIEPVPTIIIFMPLVNALTEAGSINPVHMGVVLIVTLAFGLITPPYGLVLLMASKFVGVPFSKALKAALPIYVVFLATIVFTIFAPSAVLWLPKQVMPQAVGCFKNPSGAGYICPSEKNKPPPHSIGQDRRPNRPVWAGRLRCGCHRHQTRFVRIFVTPSIFYVSQRSGSGINSLSPGTLAKRPAFQSALACSMRALDDDTKFHQMWRGPSMVAPPSSISFAPSAPASTSTGEPAASTARSPTPSWRPSIVVVPAET
jgi:hypothetical protein